MSTRNKMLHTVSTKKHENPKNVPNIFHIRMIYKILENLTKSGIILIIIINMKIQLPLYSLDCDTCELLIASRVSKLAWVQVKHISKKGEYIEVDVKNETDLEQVKKVITDLWYQITPPIPKSTISKPLDIIITLLVLAIFWMIFALFGEKVSLSSFIPQQSAGLFTMIILWFAASLSTCLAITGGIIFGFSRGISKNDMRKQLQIHGSFHGGRILGFLLWWAILWGIGNIIGVNLWVNMVLLAIAGSVLLYMWLRLGRLVPSVSFGSLLPKKWGEKIFSSHAHVYAPVVGAATFFLPCGFTQWAQIYAISTGNIVSGALAMGAFALGTLPVLFALWIGSGIFQKKNFYFLNKIVAGVVVMFGVFLLQGFYNLLWIGLPQHTPVIAHEVEDTKNTPNSTDLTKIVIPHYGFMFGEKEIQLAAGGNYMLSITPEETGTGCSESFVIPGIDSTVHPVRKWLHIAIPIYNAQSNTYPILCATTGAVQAKIIVN